MEDTTGTVERNLGCTADLLEKHKGPLSEDGATITALLEYRLDGPKAENDLFTKHSSSHVLLPTDFARDAARLWVRAYGRRFRSYCTRADKGASREKKTRDFDKRQEKQDRGGKGINGAFFSER